MAVESPYNIDAYTDREKKFLIAPVIVLAIAASVFVYVYNTIPSRNYELHEAPHAAGHAEAGHGAGHGSEHGEAKH